MAYQVKRTRKIIEDLELCNEKGEVEVTLHINLDCDAVAPLFRKKQVALIDAEKNLKAIQRMGNQADFNRAYEIYGRALVDIFEVTLGAENTMIVLGFFDENYIEMCTQLVPFISKVVIPVIQAAISDKQNQMKKLHAHKRKRR